MSPTHVDKIEAGESGVFLADGFMVCVAGSPIMIFPSEEQANRVAKVLASARTSNVHNAMNILTNTLFFDEELAQRVYHALFEDESAISVTGKPN